MRHQSTPGAMEVSPPAGRQIPSVGGKGCFVRLCLLFPL
ncbi:hypothetical protein PCLA_05f0464 [Pseudomonas citronellolis]|nr:hypothetical protein PCLA_05f0464 [Pseudomonas citronellolis]